MGKQVRLNVLFGRNLVKWAILVLYYPEAYGGSKLQIYFTPLFFLKKLKIKSSGFIAIMGTFIFSDDPFECRRRRKNKQDYFSAA
jgi:hypothetical protein